MKFNKLTPLLFALLLVFGAQAKSKKSESHIADKSNKQKLWIWMNPSQKAPERYYDSLYTVWRNYGVTGVFLEADVEKAIRDRVEDGTGNLYVLVNYTALFSTRNILKKLEGEHK